ncbi:MAG: aquaporin [Saprospiraceae bacterium]|nr:aquaporin [Saprospiraceae bacterium]
MKKYLVEAIGTLFLVLTVVMTSNNATSQMAPLAIGLTLVGMVYAGWHVSRAHFNPAVTIAVLVRGHIDRTDALYYIVSQMAGAVLASLFAVFLLNCSEAATVTAHVNKNGLCSFVSEFLGAFAWAYVALSVSYARANHSHYGVAIGFALTGMIWAFGGISGGVFSPATAFGASIAGMFDWSDFWIYLLATPLGAAAAASAFQLTQEH